LLADGYTDVFPNCHFCRSSDTALLFGRLNADESIIAMRLFSVLALLILLAGCSSTAPLMTEHEAKSASRQQGTLNESALEPPPPRSTQAEKPADPRTTGLNLGVSGEKTGTLMDCDESCRKNCSAKNQAKPKWCGLYKPPAS